MRFVPNIPIPTTQFEADVEYYLPKIDSLFLDKTGKMVLKEGEPSDNPVRPADLATGIRLYDIFMPAYTPSAWTTCPSRSITIVVIP